MVYVNIMSLLKNRVSLVNPHRGNGDRMEYWEKFEQILVAHLKIALLNKWNYPVIKQNDLENQQGGEPCSLE